MWGSIRQKRGAMAQLAPGGHLRALKQTEYIFTSDLHNDPETDTIIPFYRLKNEKKLQGRNVKWLKVIQLPNRCLSVCLSVKGLTSSAGFIPPLLGPGTALKTS